ncbi:MAG TPA: MerC domain-containing protein [Granulicella sp.]
MGSTPNPLARLHRHADTAGAAASTLCMIHCLLTPVILSVFPGIVSYLPGDAWFHRILAAGILLLGGAAFLPGLRLHRKLFLLAPIAAGMALILFVAWSGESLSEHVEVMLSIAGSLLLITAHLLNRSFCHACRTCSDHGHPCATTRVS